MHNLSMPTFPSAPHHVRHLPQGLGERAKVNRLLRTLKLHSLTVFQIPKILRARFRCMTSYTSRGHIFSIWVSIVTSLNDTSTPHARKHLRSSLHLTNPCAKRKVLNLTKPKGKIYKRKSFGHYMALLVESPLIKDHN